MRIGKDTSHMFQASGHWPPEKFFFWVALILCLSCGGGRQQTFAQDATTTSITDAGEGKISLDLKGVDIVELLKILAVKMNINIVPTNDVTGRVNIFLNNVTFDDALDIILITNSLAAVREKNIITVMTLAKYTQLYGKAYKEPRKIRMLALKHASPDNVFTAISQLKTDVGKIIVDKSTGTIILLDIPESLDLMERTVKTLDQAKDTQIFELKYAKAEDVQGQLQTVLTPGSSEVEMDARTNKLVVSDLPDKMKKIKKVIEAFDAETRQVLIEAQIVQIALNDKTQFGIDWEKFFTKAKMKDLDLKGPFSIEGLQNNLSVGAMASDHFNIVIQALNTITKTNILSRPRITVTNMAKQAP